MANQQKLLEEQAEVILNIENDKMALKKEIQHLMDKIMDFEYNRRVSAKEKIFEMKYVNLHNDMELELAKKERAEAIVNKIKKDLEDSENQVKCAQLEAQKNENGNKKLVAQLKNLKDDYLLLQVRELDISGKKDILENKLEIALAETKSLKSKLELANRRIEDLNMILDEESSCEFEDVDYDVEMFLSNHRMRMKQEKEKERKIRGDSNENINLFENLSESEC